MAASGSAGGSLCARLAATLALGCVVALAAAPGAAAKREQRKLPPSPPVAVQKLRTPLEGASTVQAVRDAGGRLPELPARIARRYHTLRIPARPRGVVLVIHGGGWWWRGRGVVISEDIEALEYSREGFVAVNVDFGPGAQIRGDVQAWYDWAARAFPSLPICASGGSSGASIALGLAAWRPRLSCVVARSPVTDLRIRRPNWAQRYMLDTYARRVFRTGRQLAEYSPQRSATRVRARVLLASAAGDPAAPCSTLDRYRRAARRGLVKVLCLELGDQQFMHLTVSKRAIGGFRYAKHALLARVAS